MALSVHSITMKKSDVPARENIVFPLQRGKCKKCNSTYWWGKMNGRGKFYPPFATQEATHWLVCGQAHAVILDENDSGVDEKKKLWSKKHEAVLDEIIVEAHAKSQNAKKKTPTNKYAGKGISSLLLDIQALSSTLKDYGRPHV